MITVQEADGLIHDNHWKATLEKVALGHAIGRILAEDIKADRDFPPFNRVTMDGIAISATALEKEVHSYPIQEIVPAGSAQTRLSDEAHCVEIMTGAVLPIGADLVIPYEEVNITDRIASVADLSPYRNGSSIHPKGRDCTKGTVLIPKGRIITAAEIAVMATVGCANVEVMQLPKVAVIATGDELVPVNEIPEPHQIRSSNVHMLGAALREIHIHSNHFHLKDDKEELLRKMKHILLDYDVVILSGGVSKGKFDFIPDVLEALGVKKLFHRIRQKPGKPFWLGRKENSFVFALPGNPISSFMCLHRYFKPWYFRGMGLDMQPIRVRLAEDFEFKKDLTYFLQVSIHTDGSGQIWATPNRGNGSGDLANLMSSQGFIELPSRQNKFNRGETYPYHPFKTLG